MNERGEECSQNELSLEGDLRQDRRQVHYLEMLLHPQLCVNQHNFSEVVFTKHPLTSLKVQRARHFDISLVKHDSLFYKRLGRHVRATYCTRYDSLEFKTGREGC